MTDEPDKITKAQADAFLIDLTELTRKHRIGIAGCGCCGSPWFTRPVSNQRFDGKYEVNEHFEDLGFGKIARRDHEHQD